MKSSLAIVGMACRYADACSPIELWENVLAQRRAFRRIPPERLRLSDYFSPDRDSVDCFYTANVGVISDYKFDRLRFRVPANAFQSADYVHWLALDIAAQALADAGFPDAEGLPRETTGVFLGNTLTGEFSRANSLRLRWPYVRRVIAASLADTGLTDDEVTVFLETTEKIYKEPFPAFGEESLVGGLSNTIAGRICNQFDFHGGGYSLDGACASSLLAVANACSALAGGDLDVALVGGVDLSLDPFELVGFAKAGALAAEEMRVYDVNSNGFWPGEGCGFVLLMRHQDALDRNLRIYCHIKGWGISSDGSGGIARPEINGQLLALERAYRRADFGIETIAYFEGHGTGTAIGDAVEVQAISRARQKARTKQPAAAIGSVKANVGHTKAAAGMAGLIKTAMALGSGILPPTTGCEQPRPELSGGSAELRTLKVGQLWPKDSLRRAGVSSMGFGGINTHVVLEADAMPARSSLTAHESDLNSSHQDSELLMLGAQSLPVLQRQIEHLIAIAGELSYAELSDLAAYLENNLRTSRVRAAIVASTPNALLEKLKGLRLLALNGETSIQPDNGLFLSTRLKPPRIGFLFPGQGSPTYISGGALRRRFAGVDEFYRAANLAASENEAATNIAQPAIVTSSIVALRVLSKLNVTADVAVGHSLGELSALCWASAINEESLLRIAKVRGRAMTALVGEPGAMVSVAASESEVMALLNGETRVSIAALNSPRQTVLCGAASVLDKVTARARARKFHTVRLPVSHAFHSELVAAAAPVLSAHLLSESLGPLRHRVFSTITGRELSPQTDLRQLLCKQITQPVRFMEAVKNAQAEGLDLWLEVGPGRVISAMMSEFTSTPVLSIDAGAETLAGLLSAVAAAFVLGQPINHRALFENRFTKPFDPFRKPNFFVNPCELAPVVETPQQCVSPAGSEPGTRKRSEVEGNSSGELCERSPLELVKRSVAARTELPLSAIHGDSRLLSDLHLNSISVTRLIAEISHQLDLKRPVSPTEFADATIDEIAAALEEQIRLGQGAFSVEPDEFPHGVDTWVRTFGIELIERPRRPVVDVDQSGLWHVLTVQEDELSARVRQKFEAASSGRGVVVCLPAKPDERIPALLMSAAGLLLQETGPSTFVMVQRGVAASAFARTLHLEASRIKTCVINVPAAHPETANWILSEAAAADAFTEVHYDCEGRRYEPVMRLRPPVESDARLPFCSDDVLIVTGGGKGITAECALSLSRKTGVRLAIIGTAKPELDGELSSNLQRMKSANVEFIYISADVADEAETRSAIEKIEAELGAITGIIHGAGINEPHLVSSLDSQTFQRTVEVKVRGARNLLAAINPARLRLLVTFSSIIARTGLPGEAHYGLANQWLTDLTETWKSQHPSCTCLALEWSVWAGVGMGERLGRNEILARQGITPIGVDEGIDIFTALMREPLPFSSVIVTGRFHDMPTLQLERCDLPLRRFLEQPRLYYPNIELIVDVTLDTRTDLYLDDHQFNGERLMPAVMTLEAMAEVAMALTGNQRAPSFEKVSFDVPVVVPEKGSTTIRLAALVRDAEVVEVVVRSEETGFQVNHCSAICRFAKQPAIECESKLESPPRDSSVPRLSLQPEDDLYGSLLFHRGRFRRLSNYRFLRHKQCVAEITPDGKTEWFSPYVPSELVIGDPGAHDAAIHAIQACLPHISLLPVGVEQLSLNSKPPETPLFVHARERSALGKTYIYDVRVTDSQGELHEYWEGLQLNAVAERELDAPWNTWLLGPYLERRVEEIISKPGVAVTLVRDDEADRQARADLATRVLLGAKGVVFKRPDGKPEVEGPLEVSFAHHETLTLAVAGTNPIACDLELVTDRPPCVWRALMGDERIKLVQVIERHAVEHPDISATRVWTASECLKKAGVPVNAPLIFNSASPDRWVRLSSGRFTVLTYATRLCPDQKRIVLAVLAPSD